MIKRPEGYYSSNDYLIKKVDQLTILVLGLNFPREKYDANPVPGYDCWEEYVQDRRKYLTEECVNCDYDLHGEVGETQVLTKVIDENGLPDFYCPDCLLEHEKQDD